MMIGSSGSPGSGGVVPGDAPVAAFTYDPSSIYAYNSVQFYDESANTPTSWEWTIDGVVFSIEQNPSYYFTVPGTYEIVLTTTNFFGSDTHTESLVVN